METKKQLIAAAGHLLVPPVLLVPPLVAALAALAVLKQVAKCHHLMGHRRHRRHRRHGFLRDFSRISADFGWIFWDF